MPFVFRQNGNIALIKTGRHNGTKTKFERMNIFVGNLDFKVKEADLEDLFEEYGTVESVKIITDKFTGRSKGYGFVIMENEQDANKAIAELNGASFENRAMVVNQAKSV
jgi:RNA recognition motif-containing protein